MKSPDTSEVFDLIVDIPVANLLNWSPFQNTVWFGIKTPVRKSDVQKAIDTKDFVPFKFYKNFNNLRKIYHIKRIATLVVKGWDDPIDIDVGCPVLNHHVDWIVLDGNHRLGAAIFRGDRTIKGFIAGQISYAQELGLIKNDK